MTPEEYEHHVAALLRSEGWSAQVTTYSGDKGLDVIAVRDGRRLGVQVKMYRTTRRVNAAQVRELVGAAQFADCTGAMLVTDGELLDTAQEAADKLGVEIRHVPVPRQTRTAVEPAPARSGPEAASTQGPTTFGEVWHEHVVPLAGKNIRTLGQDRPNLVVRVDEGGVTRETSSGRRQHIPIEVFRWAIERLLRGDTITREEINQHYTGRASSGVAAVLVATPLFEQVMLPSGIGIRLTRQR